MGYEGLVLSDDLEMKAIGARYGMREATVAAVAAGCDAVLMCGAEADKAAALEAVIYAVEGGTLPLKRVEDALARHRRVKERFLAPPRPRPLAGARCVRCSEATSTRRSPTRWRGSRNRMRRPRALRPGDRVALVAPASPFAREELDGGLAELRALGFEPVYDESVFARAGYVAGPPPARRGAPARVARSHDRGRHGRARRLRQRAPAAAARRGDFDGPPKPSSATATTRPCSRG